MPPFGSTPYAPDPRDRYDDSASAARITDLIMAAGGARARAAEQQGQIWGSTVAGLGAQAGELIGQHQEQKAMAKRDQALIELMGRPDATPQDFAAVAGPKLGLETYAAVQAFNKTKAGVSREEAAKLLPIQLKVFRKLTPEARQQLYPALRENSIKVGLFGEQDAPPEYTPDLDSTIEALESAFEKPGEGFTLSAGEVRYGPSGEELARGPEAPPKPDTRSLDARYAEAVATGDQATAQQLLRAKAQLEAAGRAPEGPKEPKLVQVETVDEQGRPVTKFVAPEAGASFAKPSGQAKPATGQQRKALSFFNRAQEANTLATELEASGSVDPTKIKYTPELANFMLDDANQSYKQAQRAFTEARLRKESGAAIPAHEYENDAKTYFAQPGDSEATKAQKAKARSQVLAGIAFEAGDALQEFFGPEAAGMVERLRNPTVTPGEVVSNDPNWGK